MSFGISTNKMKNKIPHCRNSFKNSIEQSLPLPNTQIFDSSLLLLVAGISIILININVGVQLILRS